MEDTDYILVQYNHPNRGQHKVVGGATGKFYGYRGGGARFYAHKQDIAALPNVFIPVRSEPEPTQPEKVQEPELETAEVMPHEKGDDFSIYKVPGVTGALALQLQEMGVTTYADLVEVSEEQLLALKGIGPSRVKAIRAYVEMVEKGKQAEQTEPVTETQTQTQVQEVQEVQIEPASE